MLELSFCCIDVTPDKVPALDDMIDNGRPITYRTMARHCAGLLDWAVRKGYERHGNAGLTLRKDWHVGYFKGSFDGEACYFLQWSGIEFVWI
jgi:hypothetical protein